MKGLGFRLNCLCDERHPDRDPSGNQVYPGQEVRGGGGAGGLGLPDTTWEFPKRNWPLATLRIQEIIF